MILPNRPIYAGMTFPLRASMGGKRRARKFYAAYFATEPANSRHISGEITAPRRKSAVDAHEARVSKHCTEGRSRSLARSQKGPTDAGSSFRPSPFFAQMSGINLFHLTIFVRNKIYHRVI
ncbi:hypothetical protein [Roseovarius sp. MMSF_3305]|uniref:hypothetical protein n=1 Tax=Roseovarius sp. MMSF_3305 TaxID=3046697 RepID=UPI00273EC154|nr:hypothetical protein [Roseovarius sp. MMSF_3305]